MEFAAYHAMTNDILLKPTDYVIEKHMVTIYVCGNTILQIPTPLPANGEPPNSSASYSFINCLKCLGFCHLVFSLIVIPG